MSIHRWARAWSSPLISAHQLGLPLMIVIRPPLRGALHQQQSDGSLADSFTGHRIGCGAAQWCLAPQSAAACRCTPGRALMSAMQRADQRGAELRMRHAECTPQRSHARICGSRTFHQVSM